VIRTHKHDALTMWNHFAEAIRSRLRVRFPQEIAGEHPVISARPYEVFLYTTDEVWDRVDYVEQNPMKERLPPQRWEFVTPYDNFPFHQNAEAKAQTQAKAQANRKRR
jgi:hypothetical protein